MQAQAQDPLVEQFNTAIAKKVASTRPLVHPDVAKSFADSMDTGTVPKSLATTNTGPAKPSDPADTTLGFIRNTLAQAGEAIGGAPTAFESAKGVGKTLSYIAFPPGGSHDQLTPEQVNAPIDPLGDVKSLLHNTVGKFVKGAKTKDSSMTAEGLGNTLPLVAPFAGKGARAVAEGMGALPPEAPTGGFGASEPKPAPHVEHLTNAVGATNKMFIEDKFHAVAADAFPALKAAEGPVLGRNVKDLRDVAKLAKAASTDAWKPYQQLLDSTYSKATREQLITDAISNLPDELRDTHGTSYTRIVNKYARDLTKADYTANQLESAAQTLNAELKGEYELNKLDRASARKLPQYAGREALLSSIRNRLDSMIKSNTGYDPAPLRAHYGNIKAVHNAVIETPSGDDTLFDVLTRRPLDVMKTRTITERLVSHAMRKTPDQLAARAFKSYQAEAPSTALVHAGWETPTEPESSGPDIGQGYQTPQPPSKFLYSQTLDARQPFHMGPSEPTPPPVPKQLTPGQKLLPAAGDTSVKTTPPAPESFSDALAREQTPQSKRMREVVGTGPYDKQDRPATAEEYLRTKGGREMPNTPKHDVRKAEAKAQPQPPTPTPPKGKRK